MPGQRGNWRDFVVLLALGLAVDLRWLEPAWPRGLAALGKMLLLDAGIFGFLVVRRLEGVGFDLRLTLRDLRRGLGEYCLYAVIAIPLGLWLGFLHVHAILPSPLRAVGAFVFTFLFIAIPEELFFRGWLQNLLERRMGRTAALLLTAVIFRAGALEQADGEFQLALCADGGDCGRVLRTGVAGSAARGRIGNYPCVGGHYVVALAEVKRLRTVVEIAEADAHVVQQGRGNGDGDADAEDGVGDGQRIDVARADEDEAGGESPDQRQRREDRIGQMGERETRWQ